MVKVKNKQGFTLIELLVVIAIIGLLSTLSILALNQARARARDAKRVADVKQIQTALEMYFNDNNKYPGLTSDLAPTYIGIVPTPPVPPDTTLCSLDAGTTNAYAYSSAGTVNTTATYTIRYCLGAKTGGVQAGLNTATQAGISIR